MFYSKMETKKEETYRAFVNEIAKLPIRMGSVTPTQQQFLDTFLNEHPEIKHVLETGFHVGLSAATMLTARDDIIVTSFDIFWFDYTRRAKLLLDISFPLRNILIAGNSVCSLQTFFRQFSYSPDMIFVDGGHERPIPFLDLYFLMKYIRPGTWIIVDDYCEEHGSGGVIEAVNECIQQGYITDAAAYKADDRGWIVGTRSTVPVKDHPSASPEELEKVYKDTESHYP